MRRVSLLWVLLLLAISAGVWAGEPPSIPYGVKLDEPYNAVMSAWGHGTNGWVNHGPITLELTFFSQNKILHVKVSVTEPCGIVFKGEAVIRLGWAGGFDIRFRSGDLKEARAWMTGFEGSLWIRISVQKFGQVYTGYIGDIYTGEIWKGDGGPDRYEFGKAEEITRPYQSFKPIGPKETQKIIGQCGPDDGQMPIEPPGSLNPSGGCGSEDERPLPNIPRGALPRPETVDPPLTVLRPR